MIQGAIVYGLYLPLRRMAEENAAGLKKVMQDCGLIGQRGVET
jgi:hypothetical protein